MTDQQRADMIGPGKHPNADFPNLERLRGQSVEFTRCYTAAMACVPSRFCFLTGRHAWQERTAGNSRFLQDDCNSKTWMSVLRENKYRCVSVGKTHEIHAGSHHIQVPLYDSYGDKGKYGEGGDLNCFEIQPSVESRETHFDFMTARRANEAIDRLTATSEEPFAMFVGFHAPHMPYVLPKEYVDWCKPEDVSLPPSWKLTDPGAKSLAYRNKRDRFENKFGPIDESKARIGVAGYLCMMKMIDDCVGIVLDKLDDAGLLDNTLVVFTSDHGDLLGEHGLFGKGATFHEGEVRIPMLMRFPDGKKAGESLDHLVSSIDWCPTIFDYLGIDPDYGLPGHSILPMIQNDQPVRDHVTCSCRGFMIRTERYKFWHQPANGDGELYDMQEDPGEMRNLYHDPACVNLKAGLIEAMLNNRMAADGAVAKLTRSDRRLQEEVCAAREPQVIAWPKTE